MTLIHLCPILASASEAQYVAMDKLWVALINLSRSITGEPDETRMHDLVLDIALDMQPDFE